jgi:hypothetical protein
MCLEDLYFSQVQLFIPSVRLLNHDPANASLHNA